MSTEPQRPWPTGPDYTDWVGGDDGTERPWILFKLKAAKWYTDTLEVIGMEEGFRRLVGVEMALDGSLAAMCGAFDASVAGLTVAAEAYRDQPYINLHQLPPEDKTPEHLYKWKDCRTLLRKMQPPLQNIDVSRMCGRIDAALVEDSKALGWLKEVQRLRNRTIHHTTLPRHIDTGTGVATSWSLTVGARGDTGDPGRPENPVTYLRHVHSQLEALTDTMMQVIDHMTPGGIPTSRI